MDQGECSRWVGPCFFDANARFNMRVAVFRSVAARRAAEDLVARSEIEDPCRVQSVGLGVAPGYPEVVASGVKEGEDLVV